MLEFITIFAISLALSMDAFYLSLSFGTQYLCNKRQITIALFVGLFHFCMPIFGMTLGSKVIMYFNINPNFIVGVILILLACEMIKEMLFPEKSKITCTLIGIITFSFSVSFDSFSTGIGLHAITSNIFLACLMFCVCSFVFTYMGLVLGKYVNDLIGKYSVVIGSILFFIIGIVYLCK